MASKKNKGSSKYPEEIYQMRGEDNDPLTITDLDSLEAGDEVGVYKLVAVKRAAIVLEPVK